MPLGVPLITLRRNLRAETGTSLNPLQGVAAQQTLDLILDRQQRELWDAYNWRHLRIVRPIPIAVGQSDYNYPADLPFDQITTVWFASSFSARWKPLLYGISVSMVPPAGAPLGTPCRWDNVEAVAGPGPGNQAPTITSDGGGATANVTVLSGTPTVTTVTATDPDVGQTLSYSIIGGTHASQFTIGVSTGVLSFVGTPAPNLAVGTYNVIVQVSDGQGGTDSQNITVTVNDAGPGGAPTITSNGGGPTANVLVFSLNQFVTTVHATDPDVGQTLSYSIIGGTHASLFTIGASTGVLSFIVPPTVGVYNVIVQVSDGQGGTDSQNITVTVNDVPRARGVPYAVVATNPVGQLRLFPTPASSAMLLLLEGQAAINPLVADNDKCVIDSQLITLFAAAEILANQKSEGAAMKLTKAQNHLKQLLKNQGAAKRTNHNMGGSQRYGNDPDRQVMVPYRDYIP